MIARGRYHKLQPSNLSYLEVRHYDTYSQLYPKPQSPYTLEARLSGAGSLHHRETSRSSLGEPAPRSVELADAVAPSGSGV
jgi:hypothetical protein